MNKKIAVTIGDPNSIGAEIAIKAINSKCVDLSKIILFANRDVINSYNLKINNDIDFVNIDFDITKLKIGQNDKYGGDFAYRTLEHILTNVEKYTLKSVVTAPVSKYALNLAGYNYSGQTEILQKYLGNENKKAQMLFAASDFRVLLLTRHIPLKTVSDKINKNFVVENLNNLSSDLKKYYKINIPKIALCGLNPHAGENGTLGDEEELILKKAVDELQTLGIDVSYPLPADALFKVAGKAYLSKNKQPYDCYVAIYHDQGLCAMKPLAQEKCVNTTIGLDLLRTSPSHGTAFDIAGKNIADETSMIEALKAADI